MADFLFTSESVTEGHPDKLCDQVSDAVLDAIIAKDQTAHVAVETLTKTGLVMVAGEVTTNTYVEIPQIVRNTIRGIGYVNSEMGFDGTTCGVIVAIEGQSQDINQGVEGAARTPRRAGRRRSGDDVRLRHGRDQGADAAPDHARPPPLPPPRRGSQEGDPQVRAARRQEPGLGALRRRPARGGRHGRRLHQHAPDVKHKTLRDAIIEEVVRPSIPRTCCAPSQVLHQPHRPLRGRRPMGDSGLTGRKIIVDTYGGFGRHGGGAFSGKDPSKVDRSASYYARFIAKNIVAAKLAHRCEVQLAYAIGVAEPVSLLVNTFGTGVLSDERLARLVRDNFDSRPGSLIRELDLLRPIYQMTAAYGHFGRSEKEFTWEGTGKAAQLAEAARKAGNGHRVGQKGAKPRSTSRASASA